MGSAGFRLSPAAYRRITLVALVALVFIAISGAAVRLTGSGLGCPDWPTCQEDRLVATWEYHAMVEFVNRTITGLVSAAVIVAVLGSLVRRPRRRDLTRLSLGLVGGVIAQIILGGLTVLFHLSPPLVMAHFLVSMALIANAVVLHHRAGRADGAAPASATTPVGTGSTSSPEHVGDLVELRRRGRLMVVVCAITLFLGTIVTSAGPHGGDEDVARLDVPLGDAARLHGAVVMVLLAITLFTLHKARSSSAWGAVSGRGEMLLGVLVAQTGVGYTQYFTGVPAALVGVHVAGACAVWVATLRFWLVLPDLHQSGALPTEGPDHDAVVASVAARDPVPPRR